MTAIFIGATGQNVGKTTLCLGIISGLLKRYKNIGFTKPMGQLFVEVETGEMVDKDAVLFKRRFNLNASWKDVSPVIIPHGFTRDYLNGEVTRDEIKDKIIKSFKNITANNDFTLVEGTGHVGVGSIIDMNNAKIASLLHLDMIIIATGGLGSAIDELALNIAACEKYNVRVLGVILNRVHEEKRNMILEYIPKVLNRWKIPLLGVVPYSQFLTTPTMNDFEMLFETKMLSGFKHRWRHFSKIRLVAGSLAAFVEEFDPEELIITPASRDDIIKKSLELTKGGAFCPGIILTGRHRPSEEMLFSISKAEIPAIYAPTTSYEAMKEITSLITKTRFEDEAKVNKAIELVEPYIDFDRLSSLMPTAK